jgi:site-specific recombinase XerC
MNGLKIIGAPGAVMNLNSDALIYCASSEINDEMKARMASDFGADACVRIADFAEFTRLRDRALLLVGFAGAFRRSELVALDVADIEETQTGLLVTIRRGKTDQEAQGSHDRDHAR